MLNWFANRLVRRDCRLLAEWCAGLERLDRIRFAATAIDVGAMAEDVFGVRLEMMREAVAAEPDLDAKLLAVARHFQKQGRPAMVVKAAELWAYSARAVSYPDLIEPLRVVWLVLRDAGADFTPDVIRGRAV